MTQATSQIGADQSGLAYRNADNAGKQAILNHHMGRERAFLCRGWHYLAQ